MWQYICEEIIGRLGLIETILIIVFLLVLALSSGFAPELNPTYMEDRVLAGFVLLAGVIVVASWGSENDPRDRRH